MAIANIRQLPRNPRHQLSLGELPNVTGTAADLLTPVSRPALRYFGCKWRIAPKIIDLFPPCETYLEPYGGSFSVGIQMGLQLGAPKRRIYNELNPRVRNFFKHLRDKPGPLIELLEELDYTKATFESCWIGSESRLMDAAMYYRYSWCSYSGGGTKNNSGYMQSKAARAKRIVGHGHLLALAERMQGVEIRRPTKATSSLKSNDSPETLFYLDPTYLHSTRGSKDSRHKDQKKAMPRRQYAFEMSEKDHISLSTHLKKLEGMIFLSGYPSELYRELYEAEGWERVDIETRSISGAQTTESIWMNPHAQFQRTRMAG